MNCFQGFKNFLISTHYKASKLKVILKMVKNLTSINYLQKKAKGTAGAIKNIKFKKTSFSYEWRHYNKPEL